jgi:hypothetical protein
MLTQINSDDYPCGEVQAFLQLLTYENFKGLFLPAFLKAKFM